MFWILKVKDNTQHIGAWQAGPCWQRGQPLSYYCPLSRMNTNIIIRELWVSLQQTIQNSHLASAEIQDKNLALTNQSEASQIIHHTFKFT